MKKFVHVCVPRQICCLGRLHAQRAACDAVVAVCAAPSASLSLTVEAPAFGKRTATS